MRKIACCMLACAAAWLPSCRLGPEDIEAGGPANTVRAEGLSLRLSLPRREFVTGQAIPVTLRVRNVTDEPITIVASTSSPYYIRVWRYTSVGWELLKQYPRAALMVMSPWTLAADGERVFEFSVPVEPDWPTNEPLRLTAMLNGREALTPALTVYVRSREGAGEQAPPAPKRGGAEEPATQEASEAK